MNDPQSVLSELNKALSSLEAIDVTTPVLTDAQKFTLTAMWEHLCDIYADICDRYGLWDDEEGEDE